MILSAICNRRKQKLGMRPGQVRGSAVEPNSCEPAGISRASKWNSRDTFRRKSRIKQQQPPSEFVLVWIFICICIFCIFMCLYAFVSVSSVFLCDSFIVRHRQKWKYWVEVTNCKLTLECCSKRASWSSAN